MRFNHLSTRPPDREIVVDLESIQLTTEDWLIFFVGPVKFYLLLVRYPERMESPSFQVKTPDLCSYKRKTGRVCELEEEAHLHALMGSRGEMTATSVWYERRQPSSRSHYINLHRLASKQLGDKLTVTDLLLVRYNWASLWAAPG